MRLRTFWKAAEFDEALAAGTDPLESAELLWRAQQLAEPKKRIAWADSIETTVNEVDRRGPEPTSGLRLVERDMIKDNRSLLLTLAERFRSDGPQGLRGLAMADLLIEYPDSPVYRARTPLELKRKLLAVLMALDPYAP